jgi:hypothetical protein
VYTNFFCDAPFEKKKRKKEKKKQEGGILFFLSKNMSAGFSLKIEPYSAPADVQLLTSLPVCFNSSINFGYAYSLNEALIINIYTGLPF